MKAIAFSMSLAAGLSGVGAALAAPVKVGLLAPVSGVYAVIGHEIHDGFMFALEEAGRADEFSVIVEDTEVKPSVGLAKARKLTLEDRVDALVGVVSSGVLGALRDYVHNAEMPLIVANAGNDKATGERCSPYIVRVSFSNAQINRPMGAWMARQGIEKVYTLAPDYAAGHQMIEAFEKSFVAGGGAIVGGAFTPFRQTRDFGPYLASAVASGADAVYVFYAGGEAVSFVKQYGSFGIADETPLFGAGFLTSPLYVAAEGDAAVGVMGSLHYVPTLDTPENAAFIAAFRGKYGKTPSEYAVQGYDAARLLMGAVDDGAHDRRSIAAALPKVRYVGPRGPMKIDPKTNNVIQNIYIYETVERDGALSQRVVHTARAVRDAPNGCEM